MIAKLKAASSILVPVFPFPESFCHSHISASAAERFNGLVTRKAVIHGLCTWRGEYLVKRLLKEVAKWDIAIVVKTTGYDGAIAKHAYLVAQGITECLFTGTFLALTVRPFKHTVIFKVHIVCQTPAIITFAPRTWQMLRHKLYQTLVCTVISTLVPQA